MHGRPEAMESRDSYRNCIPDPPPEEFDENEHNA
jgi:hypothetical protein